MSGRGPYGSKRGRGSPVPGLGLIPPGINGKLGKRSLWPPEIDEKDNYIDRGTHQSCPNLVTLDLTTYIHIIIFYRYKAHPFLCMKPSKRIFKSLT